MTPRTAAELARYIDHTLLTPEATRAEVLALCRDAVEWNVAAVCVSPSLLPLPGATLGSSVGLCTVAGFPSGAHAATTKAAEAALSVSNGATEIDYVYMVLNTSTVMLRQMVI
ncbi:MAG: hypothetical protein RL552_472 [Actinomycetota bacterium]